jgi:hypothetical protein
MLLARVLAGIFSSVIGKACGGLGNAMWLNKPSNSPPVIFEKFLMVFISQPWIEAGSVSVNPAAELRIERLPGKVQGLVPGLV